MRPVRILTIVLFSIVSISLTVRAEEQKTRPKTKPNLVYILADDLGLGDPGCYNPDSKIPTPAMDRLARDGMQFSDAHTPASVCTPTRYGVLTGRYSWRTRLKKWVLRGDDPALIEPGRLTIASMLKQHGYKTAAIGKWHLGFQSPNPKDKKKRKIDWSKPLKPGPVTVGFDTFFGIATSASPPFAFLEDDHLVGKLTGQAERTEYRRKGGTGFHQAGPIVPGFKHEDALPMFGEKAVEFIESQTPDQPFFLYLALNAPHTPWVPKQEFQGRSKAGYYGDYVVAADAVVKQVLDAIDRKKLAENTIVILTSDNGSHWLPSDIEKWKHNANLDCRGQKADIHEGGHRVPFIVRWPGHVRKNSTSDALICLTDLTATMAHIVGHDLPENAAEDSFDITPVLLEEKGAKGRDTIVHHSGDGMFSIRQGNWKLIEGLGSGGFTQPRTIEPKPGGPQGQLYNLAKDPAEKVNLYQKHPEIVARLHKLLQQYKKTGRSR